MSSNEVLDKMRANGFRITRQRKVIVDVILKNKYTSCKEICYQVRDRDSSIGMATVYRMIRTLEDMDVLERIAVIKINE